MKKNYSLSLILAFVIGIFEIQAQSCDGSVPSFNVNLSSAPDGAWDSPDITKGGYCCGAGGTEKCIEFVTTLHPKSEGVKIEIISGAIPSGSLYVMADCGQSAALGSILCLPGGGTYKLTFCSNGNNLNAYRITSMPRAKFEYAASEFCNDASNQIPNLFNGTATSFNGGPYLNVNYSSGEINVNASLPGPRFVKAMLTSVNGCASIIDSVFFNINPLPQNTFLLTDAPCYGATGGASASVSSGTAPYTYNWSNGSTTSSVSNLSAGSYSMTIVDSKGCVTQQSFVIQQPSAIVLTPTVTNASCNMADGSISLTASGGTPAYSYSIDGISYQSGSIFSGLSAGNYVGYVKDAQNCLSSVNVIVEGAQAVDLSVSQDVSICEGSNTSLSAIGSAGATFYWSPSIGLSSTTGSNVFANPTSTTTYTVTANNGSCTEAASVTVTVNPLPNVTVSPSSTSICYGSYVTLSASGANSYNWAPLTGLSNSTGAIVAASPTSTNTYIVYGTNANGCVGQSSVTVFVIQNPDVNAGTDQSLSCSQTSVILNGSSSISGAIFSWTGPSIITGATTQSPTVDAAGTYTLTVTDPNNGCEATDDVVVSSTGGPNVSVFPSSPSVCEGSSITLTANGAITYSWSPATGLSNTNGGTVTASPTTTTTYTVVGGDVNGCTNSAQITVFVSPLPVVSTSPDTAICEGSIVALAVSGAGSYEWYESSSLVSIGASFAASPNFTTTYDVIGTNPDGCIGTTSVTVSVNPRPIVTATPYLEICMDNTANLSASGAVSYEWSPSFGLSSSAGSYVTFTPSGSGVNTFDVIGTDINGCANNASVTITAYELPDMIITPSDPVICEGDNVTINASGALVYNWTPSEGISSTGGASVVAAPSTSTTYTIVGTDVNGCSNSAQTIVTVNSLPNLSISSSINQICEGENALIAVAGASNYDWSPSSSLSISSGPSVIASPALTTTYFVTGTDVSGCVDSANVTIVVNPLPVISTNINNDVSCFGGNDASATVIVSGGGSFNYNWSPGEIITSTATGLSAGNYSVTVVDDTSGCLNSDSVAISEPVELLISATGNNTTCGQLNGLATANATGGVAPYTYLWSSGSTSADANGLDASTYSIVVSDANGCVKTTSVNIGNTNGPSVASINSNPASCGSTCDGSAFVSVSGGTAPFDYLWNSTDIQNTQNAINLCEGTYTVQISDATNCKVSASVPVSSVMPDPVFSGVIYIDGDTLVSGKIQLYKFSNSAGAFEMLATSSINPDGTYSVTGFKQGSYIIAAIPDTLLYPYAVKTYYNNKTKWHEADTIMAYCDSTKIVNINVYNMFPMAGYATISGLIVNITGGTRTSEPLPGVDVSLEEDPGSVMIASTVTDTEGKYTFANVAVGTYKIYVDIPGLGMVETYQISINGTDSLFDNKNFYVDSTGTIDVKFTGILSHCPGNSKFELQVYPNPYKDHTTIEFELESKSEVILEIFNLYGKKVSVIEQGSLEQGLYKYAFSAKDAGYSSGVYVLRVVVNNRVITQRLIETH